jgi:hypothetical protein
MGGRGAEPLVPRVNWIKLLRSRESQFSPAQSGAEEPSRQLSERLRDTLRGVIRRRTADFSGIGLIVSDTPELLPLFPLSQTMNSSDAEDIVSCLAAISARQSEHHDGFHVISSTWRLTRVAQYFSPPIIPDAQIDRSKRFGGRYLAALFGSGIPGVLASGIASEGFGIAVFRGGRETFFEDSR